MPGVARDSTRNVGTRENNYGNIHKQSKFAKVFTPPPPSERAPGTHCIGGWVGPRTVLDAVEKRNILSLPGIQSQLSTPCPSRCHGHSSDKNRVYYTSHLFFTRIHSLFHLCVPAPTNLTLLEFLSYQEQASKQ
jgi:hypothetical protein